MTQTGPTATTETATATLRQTRGFARLWTASTTSAFGSYVTVIALPFVVAEVLAGDGLDVGLVNAARWVPYLLFGLLAGRARRPGASPSPARRHRRAERGRARDDPRPGRHRAAQSWAGWSS